MAKKQNNTAAAEVAYICNEEAEKEALAVFYFQPDKPVSMLKSDWFALPKWKAFYRCILNIQSEGKIPTRALLIQQIKQNFSEELTVADVTTLGDHINEGDALRAFKDNVQILKTYALRRKLAEIAIEANHFANYAPVGENLSKQLNILGQKIDNIVNGAFGQFSKFEDDLIPDDEDSIKRLMLLEGDALHTGYMFDTIEDDDKELLIPDRAISFVVAPTSHGKSTMLMNIALRIIQRHPNKHVLYLSYEQSLQEVITSFMTIHCAYKNAIPSKGKIRNTIKEDLKGNPQYISMQQANAYNKAKAEFFSYLKNGQLKIKYKNYDVDTLIEYVRYMKMNNLCDVLFIDYTQLLSLPDCARLSRQEQLKQICLKLKDLAIDTEYGLPIVLAAQFNRQVESPLDLLPTNIGEAGDIERVANTIAAIWNCGFTRTGDCKHKAQDYTTEYEGHDLSVRDSSKIYGKIIKRRGQKPNVQCLFNYDGRTGLITSPEEKITIQHEENPESTF